MPQFPEKTWVRDGLVSYWPLDNEQLVGSPPGATVRDVIGGNDGVTSGTITTGVTGKINEAFDFDGADDYIQLPSNVFISGANPRTVSAWFSVDEANADSRGGIISLGSPGTTVEDFAMTLFQDNGTDWWRAQFWGNDIDYKLVGSYTGLHHQAYVFDGTTVEIYYDGELATSGDRSLDTTEQEHYIGQWSGNYWGGVIDEVMIFDRALTQTEVKALYRRGVAYPW